MWIIADFNALIYNKILEWCDFFRKGHAQHVFEKSELTMLTVNKPNDIGTCPLVISWASFDEWAGGVRS